MKQQFKNQSGITLLLSILIMGAVTAIGIGMSVLLISQIRGSRNIDNSVVAYYAAETGIEDALMTVKDVRNNYPYEGFVRVQRPLWGLICNTDLSPSPGNTLNNDCSCNCPIGTVGEHIKLFNGATVFRMAATLSSNPEYKLLLENQSTFFDLYNPEEIEPSTIKSVILDWQSDGSEQVEVSWTAWNPNSGFSDSPQKVLLTSIYPEEPWPLVIETVDPYILRLQVRSLHSDLLNLKVTPYSSESPDLCEPPFSCTVDISSRINIPQSIGEYPSNYDGSQDLPSTPNASRQAISASMPWIPPLSGFFSYVLLSEEPITKE